MTGAEDRATPTAPLDLLSGRRGHFEMESGYHAELWFDLNRLFDDPQRLKPLVTRLAERLARHEIDAICGPVVGGARLAGAIAGELGVPSLHAERHERPGAAGPFPVTYDLPDSLKPIARGKAVAIVDDAISAGSAVRGAHSALVACGARPVALGTLFLLSDAIEPFAREHGLALEALTRSEFHLWKPADCPHCRARVPIERVSDAV